MPSSCERIRGGVLWDIRRLNVIMVILGQVGVLETQLLIPDDKMPER